MLVAIRSKASIDHIDKGIIEFVAKKNGLSEPGEAARFTTGQINRVYNVGDHVLKIQGDPVHGPGHDILKPMVAMTASLLERGARVPKIVDHGIVDGRRYVLMEKVRGNNLCYGWMTFFTKAQGEIH
ncbi:MAG TPA: hypothetical protein VI756_10870 [Blastocatellia bacterium]